MFFASFFIIKWNTQSIFQTHSYLIHQMYTKKKFGKGKWKWRVEKKQKRKERDKDADSHERKHFFLYSFTSNTPHRW